MTELGRSGADAPSGHSASPEPVVSALRASVPNADCARCAVLEDLLETARIQVEHARREAEKADDEALELKAEMLNVRRESYVNDYAVLCEFRRRAEAAEAALASGMEARRAETGTGSVHDSPAPKADAQEQSRTRPDGRGGQ